MSRSELFAVTGAAGFVGREVVATLRSRGLSVRPLVRSAEEGAIAVGEIGPETDWSRALDGVTHVIHAAARAHIMNEDAADPLAVYRQVNAEGTRRLAEQAVAQGVRRIVFISSIKVNGERTAPGKRFTASDRPAPEDPYGISKWEAEQVLMGISARSGLEGVVVRPPLVYGPGVKGNFARLIRWVKAGVPLPFAAVSNQRSLVSLDNLVDLLHRCAVQPGAAGRVFLAADGEDLSMPELIRRMAQALNRPARLFPVPPRCMRAVAKLAGREAEVDRLINSLQVDIGPTCETLGWKPLVTVDAGLAKTVWPGAPLTSSGIR